MKKRLYALHTRYVLCLL